MSLINTLAKVAIGVVVAKGVSTLARNMSAPGTGRTQAPPPGGLGNMMGEILGTGRGTQGGSLGGLLDQLGGVATKATRGGGTPDLGAILGQLGGAGGIGGLLGSLLGGGASGTSTAPQTTTLGGALNSALVQAGAQTGAPDAPPAPEHELAAAVLLKAMIQAAKADGQIDAGEQAKLMDRLGDVSEQERAFVQQELAAPVDPEGLAKLVPQGLEAQAYAMSVMAINLDNQAEAEYLDRLARALGLQPAAVNAIHAQVNAPALYQ